MDKEILKAFLRSITGNDIMQTNNDNYDCVYEFMKSDKYKELQQINLTIPVVVGQSEQLLPKQCKNCKAEIKHDVGDGLCAECWSRQ